MNVKMHVLRVHENKRSIKYVCEVCGRGFESPSLLAQHAVVHIDMDKCSTKVQCNICGKWQKTESRLKDHIKFHKQEPQKCSHCDEIIYSKNEMKLHISQFHAMHKHQCSICEKSFARPVRLKVCPIYLLELLKNDQIYILLK